MTNRISSSHAAVFTPNVASILPISRCEFVGQVTDVINSVLVIGPLLRRDPQFQFQSHARHSPAQTDASSRRASGNSGISIKGHLSIRQPLISKLVSFLTEMYSKQDAIFI